MSTAAQSAKPAASPARLASAMGGRVARAPSPDRALRCPTTTQGTLQQRRQRFNMVSSALRRVPDSIVGFQA
jgi:hypothetical protein